MNSIIKKIDQLSHNHSIGYALIRIFLGVALLIRGLILIGDPEAIFALTRFENFHMFYSYVTMGHIVGGGLLAIGFFTRLAALIQIPILASAAFILHIREGLMMGGGGQSIELASLVLVLLVVYFIFGSGPLAIKKYINVGFKGSVH
jgi:putative oxidoreductase